MMDPAGLQGPAITQNTRTFPIADRLQQDPVDFVPWLKRVRRHAAKQNSLFRDGNLYMNKDNQPAGTPPDFQDNPQAVALINGTAEHVLTSLVVWDSGASEGLWRDASRCLRRELDR